MTHDYVYVVVECENWDARRRESRRQFVTQFFHSCCRHVTDLSSRKVTKRVQPRVSEYVLDCAPYGTYGATITPNVPDERQRKHLTDLTGVLPSNWPRETDITLSSWSVIGCCQRLVSNIAWVTIQEFVRIITEAMEQRASVLVPFSLTIFNKLYRNSRERLDLLSHSRRRNTARKKLRNETLRVETTLNTFLIRSFPWESFRSRIITFDAWIENSVSKEAGTT